MAFLMILDVSRILFFRHQLRVKFTSLDCITFDKRCMYAANLIVREGETLESSLPPLPAHGNDGLCPLGPHP